MEREVHKPLSAKQLQALEIGSVLRTLGGCIGNLTALRYNKKFNQAMDYAGVPSAWLTSVIAQVDHLEQAVRDYNLQVVKANQAAAKQ